MPIGQSFSTPQNKVYTIGTTPVLITPGDSHRFYLLCTIPETNTGKIFLHRGPISPTGSGASPSDVLVGQGMELSHTFPYKEFTNKNHYRGSLWAIADTAGQKLAVTTSSIELL